jgi:hypothetical protein
MHLSKRTAALSLLMVSTGCAGPVEITRTYTPQAAVQAQSETALHPVAIVRAAARIPLPSDARLESGRVLLPQARLHVHKLAPGDIIEKDSQGRITAVRGAGTPPVITHFVPGTAESLSGSEEVRGVLVDGANVVTLQPTDSIEMHGTFQPDDPLPGGGRVESTRSAGMLVAGVVVFSLAYAPTAYIGFASPRSEDRVLAVPAAGPWIDLANRQACVPPQLPPGMKLPVDPCIAETAMRAALVASGALQDLGVLFALIGLPSHSRVVTDGARGVGEQKAHPHIGIVPTLGGAAAVGTF